MERIMQIVTVACLLLLYSCSEPIAPQVVEKIRIKDSTGIVLDTIETDSVRKSRVTIKIEVYDDMWSEEVTEHDRNTTTHYSTFDTPEECQELRISKDGEIIFSGECENCPKEVLRATEPFTMIDDSRVRVNRGSTAELLCRYYDLDMKEFIKLNNIKNPNVIQAGKIYRINCGCN